MTASQVIFTVVSDGVFGALIGTFSAKWWFTRAKLLRIQRQPRPRPPIPDEEEELEYVGGTLEIGERAIVDAYVRILDNLWRMRTGMYQASPLYVNDKGREVMEWTAELVSLVGYWKDSDEGLRWDVMMRAVRIRNLWSGSHQKALAVIEPLPSSIWPKWEPPSVTCPLCFMVSYNPNDITYGYCAKCAKTTSIGTCGYDYRQEDVRAAVAGGGDGGRAG